MELAEFESDYVQVGWSATEDGASETTSAAIAEREGDNSPPSSIQFATIEDVDEHGVALLRLSFDDPDLLDVHSVHVDWGDGGLTETFHVSPGATFFSTTHQYLDDDPTGTSFDAYSVVVTVTDDELAAVTATTSAVVRNVAPSNIQIAPLAAVDEHGVATLRLTFDDPGTLDQHMIEVDWGDGEPAETFSISPGVRFFSTTHQYLDDNPTGTGSDVRQIAVTVMDDDLGTAAASAPITINNIAPSNIQIADMAPVDEHGVAKLQLRFDDPGTLDQHTIRVDWGDGEPAETFKVSPGGRFFSTTHQYFDDHPSGTSSDIYNVQVQVVDDDGGVATAMTQVQVDNVPPFDVLVQPTQTEIEEGSLLGLGIEFVDPGTLDTFQVDVDWGDGHVETFNLSAGVRLLATDHVYADNGSYTIEVEIRDDDLGSAVGVAKVDVLNVDPNLTVVADQRVKEGELLSIENLGVLTDPGFDNPLNVSDPTNGGQTEETFTYDIDWGDGTPPSFGIGFVDQQGGPGQLTAASFNGQHIYADNGFYTVTVTVIDDDFGVDRRSFLVTVDNVDPTITNPKLRVAEGQAFSLSDIGVILQDPGFDNPLNTGDPSNGGEVAETFRAETVDWGDGTPLEPLSVVDRVSGSPGTRTTAQFAHAPHTYADNGLYTVTVVAADDDGELVSRSFMIEVTNVAPTLTLTDRAFVINEGETLFIPLLGTFWDPGFDNPLNADDPSNGGETQETFTYDIDWGDGTVDKGQLPARRDSGSPGVLTKGTIANRHRYLDNDEDNAYTVTVTLSDDDGGTVVESFDVTVYNVNPTLDPITATDVDRTGKTTLKLEFRDPGADSFEVLVDWGDQLSLPPEDRFVVETVHAGPTPQAFTLTHVYDGPPDPLHPAADIVISVKIRDDDFGAPLVFEIGQSNLEFVAITNPGEGTNPVFIDTTPQIPRLTFQPTTGDVVFLPGRVTDVDSGGDGAISGSAGDTRAASERFFALRVINPDGTESPAFRLPDQAMDDLPSLFARLPDNHYAIYLVRTETNTWRLVMDVFVRDGRLIDPGDDSEGSRDRPPTEDSAQPPSVDDDSTELDQRPVLPDNGNVDAPQEQEGESASAAAKHAVAQHPAQDADRSSRAPGSAEASNGATPPRRLSPHSAALAGAAVGLSGSTAKSRASAERSTRENWRSLRTCGYFLEKRRTGRSRSR